MTNESKYGIVSSGDPEKDRSDLDRFLIHEARIKAGDCPNGCCGMKIIDEYNAECPRCGFNYSSTQPINFEIPGGVQ